jgi:hypothetical protein
MLSASPQSLKKNGSMQSFGKIPNSQNECKVVFLFSSSIWFGSFGVCAHLQEARWFLFSMMGEFPLAPFRCEGGLVDSEDLTGQFNCRHFRFFLFFRSHLHNLRHPVCPPFGNGTKNVENSPVRSNGTHWKTISEESSFEGPPSHGCCSKSRCVARKKVSPLHFNQPTTISELLVLSKGDVTKVDTLLDVMKSSSFDAIVSCIGVHRSTPWNPTTLYSEGMQNILEALKR